ncbi:MAG: hypothetical protein PHQ23_08110 [Candidatus Wallbacteria bacterium]|nr:hypothetical protein [Candidatus Wallbacteria bacterium]
MKDKLRKWIAIFLSIYLLAYLADALLSLTDAFLTLFFQNGFLTLFRILLALAVMVASFAVYFMMFLTPMIPKTVFLPPAAFICFGFLLFIPLYLKLGSGNSVMLAPTIVQFTLSLLSLYLMRNRQKGIFFPVRAGFLSDRFFSLRNTVGFSAFNLFIVLPSLALYLVVCVNMAVRGATAGFVGLGLHGLNVAERSYLMNTAEVRLSGMVHIGQTDFYRELEASFPEGHTLVLMEGVTDHKNLIKFPLDYRIAANALGLGSQSEDFVLDPERYVVENCDLDVEEFSQKTIDLINMIARFMNEGLTDKGMIAQMARLNSDASLFESFMSDALEKRNQHLLKAISEKATAYDRIIVPWGALHLAGIEKGLKGMGYSQKSEKVRTIIPYRALWSRLSSFRFRKAVKPEKTHDTGEQNSSEIDSSHFESAGGS